MDNILKLALPGLLVSVITVIYLIGWHAKKIAWQEIVIAPLIAILIGTLGKFFTESVMQSDTEYWGTWVIQARHQEDWTEWEEVTDYCTKTDSKGNTTTYACGSHIEYHYHPDVFSVVLHSNDEIIVDQSHYEELKSLYGPRQHERRSGHHDDYHRAKFRTGDGYLHVCTWPGSQQTFRPATVEKAWRNRVLAAKQSLFHFREVSKEEKTKFGIYDYPEIHTFYHQDPILGPNGPIGGRANEKLKEWNAKLGPEKQVKMFILLYYNQPYEAALIQESYWQGGNKNEFILCVGLDNANKPQWSKVISWSEDEDLKVRVQDFAASQKTLDLVKIVDFMVPAVRKQFHRKEFKVFDYLQVEPPTWAYILSFFLALLANVGFSYWAISNTFDHGDSLVEYVDDVTSNRPRWNKRYRRF